MSFIDQSFKNGVLAGTVFSAVFVAINIALFNWLSTSQGEPIGVVKITSELGAGTGVIIRKGKAIGVSASVHSLGIPRSFDIELQSGTKRRAILDDPVLLRIVPPEGIVE